MPNYVKSINELTFVHKIIKADSYGDIFYYETCKNLIRNFGEKFKSKIKFLWQNRFIERKLYAHNKP